MAHVAVSDEDLRPLRIIANALIAGPALFLGVAFYLRSEGVHGEESPQDVVTWMSLFVGLALILISLLLPRPKRGDIGSVRGHFLQRLALVEGGSLFGTVAFLLEGQTIGLVMAVLCIAAMIVLHYPTTDRVNRLLAEPS